MTEEIRRNVAMAMALAAIACAPPQAAPLTYSTFRGTIRDSATGQPVAGLYVWPFRRADGVVTDSGGRFEIPRQYGETTFLIRACTDSNLTTLRGDFTRSRVVEQDGVIAFNPFPCPQGSRPPWVADATDSTMFLGLFTYSWEGGGWLTACDGRRYQIDRSSAAWDVLDRYSRKEGQETFVRARGRLVEDGLNVFPPGPLFLPDTVLEARPVRARDCQPAT